MYTHVRTCTDFFIQLTFLRNRIDRFEICGRPEIFIYLRCRQTPDMYWMARSFNSMQPARFIDDICLQLNASSLTPLFVSDFIIEKSIESISGLIFLIIFSQSTIRWHSEKFIVWIFRIWPTISAPWFDMNVPLHISVDKLLQLGKSSNPESVKFSQSLVWDFIIIQILDRGFTGETVHKKTKLCDYEIRT